MHWTTLISVWRRWWAYLPQFAGVAIAFLIIWMNDASFLSHLAWVGWLFMGLLGTQVLLLRKAYRRELEFIEEIKGKVEILKVEADKLMGPVHPWKRHNDQ